MSLLDTTWMLINTGKSLSLVESRFTQDCYSGNKYTIEIHEGEVVVSDVIRSVSPLTFGHTNVSQKCRFNGSLRGFHTYISGASGV